MTAASSTSADVVTRSGSVLIPNALGSRDSRLVGSCQDVLSHDMMSFDASRASTANMCPTSPSKRIPSTKRVRCLLRRRKLGTINAGLKFVLVESLLLPDMPPTSFNSNANGAAQGSDDDMSDDGGEQQRDESEVARKGWLSLERAGSGKFLPRYFTLTEVGLGYSKGPEKSPKNDATHCVLLPHLHVAPDISNTRRFRVRLHSPSPISSYIHHPPLLSYTLSLSRWVSGIWSVRARGRCGSGSAPSNQP